jgi:hypothetical protein
MTSADRLRTLRGAVLASLEEYDTPLSAGWLAQHRVTLDEAVDLMDDLRGRIEFAEVTMDRHRSGMPRY